jgi:NAD(P)-dependent dehydrogenase (short-subunit alcohol dehydrogenase family)
VRLTPLTIDLVFITGAGSGIGRATAVEFARNRATTVVVTDIDEGAARDTMALIRGKAGLAHAYHLDVTDPDEWEHVVDTVCASHGVPDVLVNNAGIAVSGSFFDHTPADWDRQIGVNLFGVVHGCRTVGQRMVDRGRGGHIVNIASAAAYTPVPVLPAYCVSKAGVKMLSECLRSELAPHGIGVTAICPGFINTNIGANGTAVGLGDEQVERGKRLLERVQEIDARLPVHVADPREVALAVKAAVRLDLSVVPVRPESWLGYTLSRLSPGLARRTMAPFTAANAERVARRLPASVRGLVAGDAHEEHLEAAAR